LSLALIEQPSASPPVLIGNYVILNTIAEGGMGSVHKARHVKTGQIVAIKIVHAKLLANDIFRRRIIQEYTATCEINHPNIVRMLDFGREGDSPYLVMEFVDGESLAERLGRVGALPEKQALWLISRVAQGLHKAHRLGLIHRDVKPGNVLLTEGGDVKLTDFGLMRELDTDQNLTRTGRGLGTPYFMAPEQFRNAKRADVRCDIYSLAATLYQTVTGKLPFDTLNPLETWMKKTRNEIVAPRELVPGLSERVDWAIRRSMSAEPAERAATCREFIEDLIGRSTKRPPVPRSAAAGADVWYLVYQDEEGTEHTVKSDTQGIRRCYKEGLLGDASQVRVGRDKQGPLASLRDYPEFRDLVIDATPLPRVLHNASRAGAGTEASAAAAAVAPAPASAPVPASTSIAAPKSPGTAALATPHIEMGLKRKPAEPPKPEWLKWAAAGLLAACVGAAGYVFTSSLVGLLGR
jgi:serine/threonine protein kinase